MKIAIDITQIIYGTGVSNYTKSLVKNLLLIDHDNSYLLFGTSLRSYFKLREFCKELENYQNVHFKLLPFPPSIFNLILGRFRIFPIDKFIGEVDIFHSSDWTQPRVKSENTKKITTIHDMVPFLFQSSVHPKIVASYKRRLNYVKKEVDIILADSETTKIDIIKFLEVPENKIKVVYLAPNDNFKNLDTEKVNEVLTKYKIKKPYILSVATQEPRKNIQKLLDAFEQIQKRRPELNLVLTGKYGWGPGLRTGENVIWTGYVPDEDLVSLYSGCRVFAYASLYEGFGLPILEAMACGAPVVTSNNSSMVEIAKNAAILIDPRSHTQLTRALEMVLDLNMENYQKMAQASLKRAKEYSWAKTAEQTLAAYKELHSKTTQVKNNEEENIVKREETKEPDEQKLENADSEEQKQKESITFPRES